MQGENVNEYIREDDDISLRYDAEESTAAMCRKGALDAAYFVQWLTSSKVDVELNASINHKFFQVVSLKFDEGFDCSEYA